MSDEEDTPQDIQDWQKDIIIDLLGKAKRRLKRSVWGNLKLAFHYEPRKRLDPENPEDRKKLEEMMSAGYFVKKGIRQLHKNLQEYKFSGTLEDAKQFTRRVGSPVGTGVKKIPSAVGPAIAKYTEKFAGYKEDWLQKFGYFAEVTTPKAVSKAGEILKRVPGELNKDLKKASGELDRDFGAAFHYTRGKRLDSKNPEDLKILEETRPANYAWPKYVYDHSRYNEKNWFNKNFGLMENGDLMSGKTRVDVDALHDNFNKTKKSVAHEALKKFYNHTKDLKIRNYGWSDLGRSLYDGVGKIGDGILYFPRRHWERERKETGDWEEIYCGFTPRMNDYKKAKRLEREALKEALKERARAQAAGVTTQFIPVGTGTSSPVVYMFNYQPQILAVDPSLFNRNQGQTN